MRNELFLFIILGVCMCLCTGKHYMREDIINISGERCAVIFHLTNQVMNDMRMHSRSKEQYKMKLENFWFNRYLASDYLLQ